MANSKSDNKAPKTMDVVQPGKAAPPATSRPVIVTNRPLLRQDPMMVSADGMEKPEEPAARSTISRVGKTLSVLSPQSPGAPKAEAGAPAPAPVKVKDAASEAETSTPEKPAAVPQGRTPEEIAGKKAIPVKTDEKAPESDNSLAGPEQAQPETPASPPSEPVAEAPKPSNPPSVENAVHPSVPSPSAVSPTQEANAPVADATTPTTEDANSGTDASSGEGVGSNDEQLAPNKAIDDAKKKADDAEMARVAEQERIIASRQYYLPIRNTEARRGLTRSLIVLLLVLILAAVWLDVVLDAGILHIGNVQSLTHFFK